MCDRAKIFLYPEEVPELVVRPNHVARRTEAVLRDLDRRRQDQKLGRATPVANQRRQHNRRRERALRVLLGDGKQEIADQPAAGLRIAGTEYGPGEIEHPGLAS